MRYKENWPASKARLSAFWEREIVDRCCFAVVSGRTRGERRVPGDAAERLRHWTDPEDIIRRYRDNFENTFFGGEAIPQIFVDLGAGGHAGFFAGARYTFGDSVWFHPSIEHPSELVFDENSFLYQKTLALARAFVQDSQGDYFVSCPDSTGNLDALSHLMGPEALMEAMMDEPEAVQAALVKVQGAYERVMTEVLSIVRDTNEGGGTIGWLHTWAPGKHAQMQCDMSVMLSPAMFETFAMPELIAQCDLLDYPLYHFDGMEQTRHLDMLLSIPRLRVIQWTQVSGQPDALHFIPQLKRIQAAGKGLLIWVTAQQIEPLMAELSSKGLYLLANAKDRQEADAMIRLVEKCTHD